MIDLLQLLARTGANIVIQTGQGQVIDIEVAKGKRLVRTRISEAGRPSAPVTGWMSLKATLQALGRLFPRLGYERAEVTTPSAAVLGFDCPPLSWISSGRYTARPAADGGHEVVEDGRVAIAWTSSEASARFISQALSAYWSAMVVDSAPRPRRPH